LRTIFYTIAELDNHHHRIDRVQQYSEKRTHITATDADLANFRRRDSSGAVQRGDPPLPGGRHISGLLGRQYDSLSEMADLSDGGQEQQQLVSEPWYNQAHYAKGVFKDMIKTRGYNFQYY
uniref:Myeloid leukemia factor 1 n=1 Tax=Hymenolepis diminuta TaxID=6216 RepID=A0A0R3SL48_HYMDI